MSACDGKRSEDPCAAGPAVVDPLGVRYPTLLEASDANAEAAFQVCPGTIPGQDTVRTEFDQEFVGAGAGVSTVGGPLGTVRNDVVEFYPTGRVLLSDLSLSGGFAYQGFDDDAEDFQAASGGGFAAYAGEIGLVRVAVVDNSSDIGGGGVLDTLDADPTHGAVVTVVGGEFLRNTAQFGGGAVALLGPGTLVLEEVDMGTPGLDDNSPDDIAFYARRPGPGEVPGDPLASYSFDGVVSVTCAWETLTCE